MNEYKIGFIGGGNMAKALIAGLITDGFPASQIWVSKPSANEDDHLRSHYGVHLTTDNKEVCQQVDVLVFAVKPNKLQVVIEELAENIQSRPRLLISVVAGIRLTQIKKWLGIDSLPIVRAMPNTPAMVGSGATALYAENNLNEDDRSTTEEVLRCVGAVAWMNSEHDLEVISAVIGAGPAYFFYLMEQLQNFLVSQGIDSELGKLFTMQTAFGASKMAMQSEDTPVELRCQVSSPNGITEAAIKCLQENGFDEIFKKALNRGIARAEEIAEAAALGGKQ